MNVVGEPHQKSNKQQYAFHLAGVHAQFFMEPNLPLLY